MLLAKLENVFSLGKPDQRIRDALHKFIVSFVHVCTSCVCVVAQAIIWQFSLHFVLRGNGTYDIHINN